jgi:hypothetical protein
MAGRTSGHGPTVTTMTWRFIALLWLASLGGLNAGCSFIFMESLPADHAKQSYFDCTSTYGLAVADGFVGMTGVIGAGTTLSQSKQEFADKNNGASRNAAAGVDIALAGILAGSAAYGVVQATRCDRAKEALKARIFAAPLRPPVPPSLLPVPEPAPPAQPPPTLSVPGVSFPPPSPALPAPGPATPAPVPPTSIPAPAAPTP